MPYGSGEYIERDFGMDVESFYTNVWWPDIQELAEEHGVRYTGLVIENYSDEHAAPLSGNTDTRRFQYFGNELLNMGGEIGFHGYNHMPLVLPNFYYGEEYESYRQWESPEDIRAAMAELNQFCRDLYPDEKFQVYVPPSNVLSEEGRAILAEDFLDIKAIASIYFEGQAEYTQESEFRFSKDAKDYLVKKAGIALPEKFLKRWIFVANEGKFTMEEIEKEFDMFLEDFRWNMVRGYLMDKYQVKVEEADLLASAKAFAAYQFAMYGIGNVPDDQLDAYAKSILSQEKEGRRVLEQVEDQKTLDAVRGAVTLDTRTVSVEEFRDLK